MSPSAMRTFRRENISASISTFRPGGEVPVLEEQYWDGGQCRIFKANFSDGESWCIRLPIHVQSDSHDAILSIIQGEQDVLEELNERKFPWAPKHHGSSLTFENPVGFPFIVLSWIEGLPLYWTENYPPRPIRDRVLWQVAKIQVTLIECTKEDRGTVSQYFSRLTENKISRVRDGKLPGITVQDCVDQKDLLDEMLGSGSEYASFALDHGDLAPLNIIVDSDYNITGVIDWGFASKVPLQLAGRMPRFLQLPDLTLPPSLALQNDRRAYSDSLKSDSTQTAAWMLDFQSFRDVDMRHCILESMINKGMHIALLRLRWELPYKGQEDECEFDEKAEDVEQANVTAKTFLQIRTHSAVVEDSSIVAFFK